MSVEPARVVVDAPADWTAATLEPPDLSQSPQIALVAWRAWRPADAPARLVTACFSAATGTWTPEAEPIVLDKLAQVATSTALRVAEVGALHAAAPAHLGDVASQRLESRAGQPFLVARTFLGFQEPGVVACFALCVSPDPTPAASGAKAEAEPACAASVEGARLEGALGAPPRPGLGLTVTMAAVHHPRVAAGFVVGLAALGAMLAVATRRRPRAGPRPR